LGDQTVSGYLADVLVEFARSDRLYRIGAPAGRRLTSVVETLSFERPFPAGKRSGPSAAISVTTRSL
jgi:hypothetical protein